MESIEDKLELSHQLAAYSVCAQLHLIRDGGSDDDGWDGGDVSCYEEGGGNGGMNTGRGD